MIAEVPPYLDFNKPIYHVYTEDKSCVRLMSYIKPKPKNNGGVFYSFLNKKYLLDNNLKEIVELLVKSENILSLENNWDGSGSEKISHQAWAGMSNFLIGYSKRIYKNFGYVIDVPKIYPSLNGSIDVLWETETYGFMINFDKSGEIANYFADNKDDQMSQGVFNPTDFEIHIIPKAISF